MLCWAEVNEDNNNAIFPAISGVFDLNTGWLMWCCRGQGKIIVVREMLARRM